MQFDPFVGECPKASAAVKAFMAAKDTLEYQQQNALERILGGAVRINHAKACGLVSCEELQSIEGTFQKLAGLDQEQKAAVSEFILPEVTKLKKELNCK